MTYALIQNGVVANIIEWDGSSSWQPPKDTQTVQVPAGVLVGIGYAYDGKAFSAPVVAAPVLTTAQTIALYEAALQVALDAGAKGWGYDSIVSAASYAASTSAQFKAEALALIGWRDAVWVWAGAQLSSVQAGTQAMPATPAAFVALMPAQPVRPKAA